MGKFKVGDRVYDVCSTTDKATVKETKDDKIKLLWDGDGSWQDNSFWSEDGFNLVEPAITTSAISVTTPLKTKTVTTIDEQTLTIGQGSLHIEPMPFGIVLKLDEIMYTPEDIRQLAAVFNEMVEVLK